MRDILDYIFIQPWRLVLDSPLYSIPWWKALLWGFTVWFLPLITFIVLLGEWLSN